jgi:5-(carboxyamino)imidazole ribonucleotide synthase
MQNPSKSLFSNPNHKMGILGGGQLGKMLLTETRKYDLTTHVMDPAADAPCRMACNHFVVGDLNDYDSVYQFGQGLDVLTIEIEHVNVDALAALEQEGVEVHPAPNVLRIIQDKTQQKTFFAEQQIPTAPFKIFASGAGLREAVAMGEWSLPFVWKIAKGGYDGFGVSVIKTKEQLETLPDTPCIAENLIPFEKELAVVVCRNKHGASRAFPTVEMAFHPVANQVEFVICPARVSKQITQKAEALALRVAEAFGVCGLLAVEMFLTSEGALLVNEVAPRPHNSGHLTIEGCYTSQFEQHLRGVLGLPLGSTRIKTPAVMANLVGADGFNGPVRYEGFEQLLDMEGVNMHIYGKAQTRPFRKMGHVTTIGPDLDTALTTAQLAKQTLRVVS